MDNSSQLSYFGSMSAINILQIFVTLFFFLFLKPHLALIVQVIIPKAVKLRFKFKQLPLEGPWEELKSRGYRYLGVRKESLPLLLNNNFFVFYHPEGRFLDISTKNPRNFYFISGKKSDFFVITRNFGGPSVEKNNYLSTKEKASPEDMEKLHKTNLFQKTHGDKVKMPGSIKMRLTLARLWYKNHIRSELLAYSFFSTVITAIGIIFCLRVWFVI